MSKAQIAVIVLLSSYVGAPTGAAAQGLAEVVPDTEAQSALRAGQAHFQRGFYESAMKSFHRAYDLARRPELLYNIGESADRANLLPEALEAFDAYLEDVSAIHPRRAAVERRVLEIRAELDDDEPPEGPGVLPAIVAGVGGAAAIGGSIMVGVGLSDRAALEHPDPAAPPADVEDARSEAWTLTGVGVVLATLGVLALIGGLYWGLSDADGDVEVQVNVGPGSVLVRGRF